MDVAPLPAQNRMFTRYGLEGEPVEVGLIGMPAIASPHSSS